MQFDAPQPARARFFWRTFLAAATAAPRSDADALELFTRLAAQKGHGALCKSLALYLRTTVSPWAAAGHAAPGAGTARGASREALLARLAAAEAALAQSVGALLAEGPCGPTRRPRAHACSTWSPKPWGCTRLREP